MTTRLRLAALLAAALPLLPALAAPAAPAEAPAAAPKASVARVTIPVGGMTCGGCVNTVTGKLQAVPGVKTVEVNLEKKRALVTYDAARVSAAALVEAVRDAGFEPGVPVAN